MVNIERPAHYSSSFTNQYIGLSSDDFSELELLNGDSIYLIDEGKRIYYDQDNVKFYYDDGTEYSGGSGSQ